MAYVAVATEDFKGRKCYCVKLVLANSSICRVVIQQLSSELVNR